MYVYDIEMSENVQHLEESTSSEPITGNNHLQMFFSIKEIKKIK